VLLSVDGRESSPAAANTPPPGLMDELAAGKRNELVRPGGVDRATGVSSIRGVVDSTAAQETSGTCEHPEKRLKTR
jgi:hypothetical protein